MRFRFLIGVLSIAACGILILWEIFPEWTAWRADRRAFSAPDQGQAQGASPATRSSSGGPLPFVPDDRLVGSLPHLKDRVRKLARERLWRVEPRGMSALLHRAMLFGKDSTIVVAGLDSGESGKTSVLSPIFLRASANAYFGAGNPPLARTRHGLRVPMPMPELLSLDQTAVESHPAQVLATLAVLGVPESFEFELTDPDSRGNVELIVNDLVETFQLNGEIYWEVMALVLYRPQQSLRSQKLGEVTFDEILRYLLDNPLEGQSCGGVHSLMSLTAIHQADRRTPILSPRARSQLRQYLSEYAARAEQSQAADGSWGLRWHESPFESESRDPVLISDDEYWRRILATGHLLEWHLYLSPDVLPDATFLRRSADWLAETLSRLTEDPAWVRRRGSRFCAAVHAVRSMSLLAGMTPGELVDESPGRGPPARAQSQE